MSVFSEMDRLRKEIEEKTALLSSMEQEHFDVHGIWKFSTEGDCEGRSSKDLGTYKGSLFDGIKKYGDRSYYSLSCERIGFLGVEDSKPSKRTVHFSVKDKSIRLHDKQDHINKLMTCTPEGCVLKESSQYGCIALEWEE
ncbi:UNVERIFIED_CONTAM: hypothetical protein ABIC26_002659 [Paenibacillus sp. PvR008]